MSVKVCQSAATRVQTRRNRSRASLRRCASRWRTSATRTKTAKTRTTRTKTSAPQVGQRHHNVPLALRKGVFTAHKLDWTDLPQVDPFTRRVTTRSLATRVSVATWLAAAKLIDRRYQARSVQPFRQGTDLWQTHRQNRQTDTRLQLIPR